MTKRPAVNEDWPLGAVGGLDTRHRKAVRIGSRLCAATY
jgi:hypothetical protein